MRKILSIFYILVIWTVQIPSSSASGSGSLDKPTLLVLNQIADSVFHTTRLDQTILKTWRNLVHNLHAKGWSDWNSLVQYILDRINRHHAGERDFYRNRLEVIKAYRALVFKHVTYLKNRKSQLVASEQGKIEVKLKDLQALSAGLRTILKNRFDINRENTGELGTRAGNPLGLPDKVPPAGMATPDELDALLDEWDEELQSIGEDAQLANLDMQNMMQKQQQTMQGMSSIAKLLYGSVQGEIRKIG